LKAKILKAKIGTPLKNGFLTKTPTQIDKSEKIEKLVLKQAPKVLVKPQVDRFKIGDKVVCPPHGVGEINLIKTQKVGGDDHKLFDITILDSGLKISVPVSQAEMRGMRKVMDKRSVEMVYKILKTKRVKSDNQPWNRRSREYWNKITNGSIFEIAEVMRDLSNLKGSKELSFGEKKMLERAQTLLVSEIAIAKARTHDKVMGEIKEIFS